MPNWHKENRYRKRLLVTEARFEELLRVQIEKLLNETPQTSRHIKRYDAARNKAIQIVSGLFMIKKEESRKK